MNTTVDLVAVKAESEATIKALGGQICDWLPVLDRTSPRGGLEACDRALAMHAVLQLAFGAPKQVIREWLEGNNLMESVSAREHRILVSTDAELDTQTTTDLYWYIEALWALTWAGSLVEELHLTTPVGSELASLLPDLRKGEPASSFRSRFALRSYPDLFRSLDLHYRAHWYARNGQLNNYLTEPFKLDIIMERRKALEWLADESIPDWDDTPQDT